MKRILCLLMISGLMLAGCSGQKGEAVVKAVAVATGLKSTLPIEGQIESVTIQIDAARDIIIPRLDEMVLDDQVNLQIVQVHVIRAEQDFKDGRLQSAMQAGIYAYQKAVPILQSNKTLFTAGEWNSLVALDHSLRRLYDTVSVEKDAQKLKEVAKIIGRVVKVAAKVVKVVL